MPTSSEKFPSVADFDDDVCAACGELLRFDGTCGTADCDGPSSSSGEVTSYTARTVSLDPYRTEGVSVFAGYSRGIAVAEAILEEHGLDVTITLPNDVHYVGTHFRAGFHEVLPDVEIPSAV